MIKESIGKISDELYALGSPALPAYLLMGKCPVLFDAGMTFMGPLYLRELKKLIEQEERPFLINLKAQVKAVAERK